METTPLLLVVVCFLVTIGPGESILPGAKVRLSQKGLDYAAAIAVRNLNIQGQRIGDQHGNDRVAGGKVEYDITGTIVRSFGKPSSTVVVSPGKGITLSATGASVSLHGDWRYKYRWHFIKIRDHGSFDVSASGVDFSISFVLGKAMNGKPTIKTTSCSSNVAALKVKFHGGASWLYNLFNRAIAKSMKGKLTDLMCKQATKLVNEDAAKILAEVNLVSPMGNDMVLDYGLTQAPTFNPKYMDVMLKGEVDWKTAPGNIPFSPKPFGESTDASKMFYIWGSEFIINSYIYAAYKHHLVHYNLSKSGMPKGEGNYLNLTCPSLKSGCIGNFLNKASILYPKASVMIDMGAISVPSVTITPEGINFHADGTMALYAGTSATTKVFLVKLQVIVDISLTVRVDGTLLKGKVLSIEPAIKILDSIIGPISTKSLNGLFKMAADQFIVKELNKLGEKGMVIPNIKKCHYSNPIIKMNTGNLLISTDLHWSPYDTLHLYVDRDYKLIEQNKL